MKTTHGSRKTGSNFTGPFRHVIDKTKLFFKSADSKGQKDTGNSSSKKDRLKELLERLDANKEHIDSILQNEALKSSFHSYLRNIATVGFNDGVNGYRNPGISEMATGKAGDMYDVYCSFLADREKKLTEELALKNPLSVEKQNQLILHRDYQNYIQHQSNFNDRGNTFLECALYLFFFVITFAADVFLAADLLRRLFEKTPGPPISIGNIREHLHAILLAFGVSASSIYIKLWYDEYVGKKYGQAYISEKKFEELFNKDAQTVPLGQGDKDVIRKENRKTRTRKNGLLWFTGIAIIELGIFRGYAWLQSQRIGTIPTILIPLTTIVLTLLLSLVGGACLSMGLSIITTNRRLNKSHKKTLTLESALLAASDSLTELKGNQAGFSTTIQKLGNGEEWRKNIVNTIVFFYDSGFNEGMTDPGYYMQHLDFFDRLLLLRDLSIANTIKRNKNT